MKTTRTLIFLAITGLLFSCKTIKEPKAVGAIPSQRQLDWHQLEYYAFIHFNMNTFTDMEWGLGDEKPEKFNPTNLDVNQWVRVAKSAGMKGIIITAKHHDGFCLWPSAYTEHSVKNSPWKNGKGDLLKELSEACKKAGLKFGVYLSPWDRHHAEYGKEEYVTYFHNQLRELLTNYGEIFEVWFDGANGGTGYYGGANEERKIDSKTYYQWDKVNQIVRELQPNAVIFGDGGPDVRWIGNEYGYGTETNWASFNNDNTWAGHSKREHLQKGDEDGDKWIPAEADVSIRPGWYYHKREDHQVRSLEEVVAIYYNSVGRNASLLLNLPVDTRGLVHENDIKRLMELKYVIDADFSNNLISKANIKASNVREKQSLFEVENVADDNNSTYWTTDEGIKTAMLEFSFDEPTTFNRFLVQEYIPLGQRVKEFKLEYQADGQWNTIDKQTTIGYKRILRFEPVTTSKIRFTIIDSKDIPIISNIGIYNAPNLLVAPKFKRSKDGDISLSAPEKNTEIFYTLDGTNPTENSLKYEKPFFLDEPTILKTIAFDRTRNKFSDISTHQVDVSKKLWNVTAISSGDLSKTTSIIDEDPKTSFSTPQEGVNQSVTINLGETLDLKGFTYLPAQDRWASGTISHYVFEVSLDGKKWIKASEGEFGNIKNNPIEQRIHFDTKKAKFIRLSSTAVTDNSNRASFAEIGIITK
ncbi:alpha-L-fucosidase [Capnocytophaga cynodegmi]|uniref:alpha-L-fucosidase n=1 Tax=Capnocytophaga cynodegmi TaxID=28189 RepID=UPI0037D24A60